jgi:S1-C subfamily serine protease
MSPEQVEEILGPPRGIRTFGDHTYYFYDNDCEECGTSDLVVFRDGRVVDCIFRAPDRIYTGVSSSPRDATPQPTARGELPALPAVAAQEEAQAQPQAAEPGEAVAAAATPADTIAEAPEEILEQPEGEPEETWQPVLRVDQSVSSEAAEHVPEVAKQLIVHVIGYFNEGRVEELGAGIVFGASEERVYIATADHVLRYQGQVADEIRVVFRDHPQELVAADRDTAHPQLDLAVVSVPREWVGSFDDGGPAFDRRGDVGALKTGDRVTPMGCPNGDCWAPPTTPDRVFAKGRFSISFESVSITTGYSGGGLFNEWWEVVGMITDMEGRIARADAIPINTLLESADDWGYPVQLRRPAIPRGGYLGSLGVSILFPVGAGGGAFPEDRFPSGRVTYLHVLRPSLSVHAGVFRLTPENLSVTAGMAGVGFNLRTGRFTARPFVEAGFGHVEARFDTGGYFVDDGGSDLYVPNWDVVKDDGLGVGLGLGLEAVVLPRVILELTGGYWQFNTPDEAPYLPDIVLGAGLRYGV